MALIQTSYSARHKVSRALFSVVQLKRLLSILHSILSGSILFYSNIGSISGHLSTRYNEIKKFVGDGIKNVFKKIRLKDISNLFFIPGLIITFIVIFLLRKIHGESI